MSELDWRHDGRRPQLSIIVLAPDGGDLRSVEATALLDTGATTSAITREVADALHLPVMGKRPISFGHAEELVERYIFRIGFSRDASRGGGYPFVFPEVEGFRLRPAFQFSAIVGMDILSQCDLCLRRDGSATLTFGRSSSGAI